MKDLWTHQPRALKVTLVIYAMLMVGLLVWAGWMLAPLWGAS